MFPCGMIGLVSAVRRLALVGMPCLMAFAVLVACEVVQQSAPTPEPTATPTLEATATATPEPTTTPTLEPTSTSTPEPTRTPTPEPTSTPTPEPTNTPTPERRLPHQRRLPTDTRTTGYDRHANAGADGYADARTNGYVNAVSRRPRSYAGTDSHANAEPTDAPTSTVPTDTPTPTADRHARRQQPSDTP